MPPKVVILGTGGNCVDILETVLAINMKHGIPEYKLVAFLDDNESLHGTEMRGVPVLGPLERASEYADCLFVNGIGSPNNFWLKEQIIARTGVPLERFVTVVHPTASISPSATLGQGTVVLQNVTITSNVTIGNHVIILPNCVISHDDVIGDYTSITGGVCISGGVKVGKSCYLGTNSSIIGNTSIGDGSLVGMGSVVLEAVPPNTVVVGNPARVTRPVK